jgi:lysozyme
MAIATLAPGATGDMVKALQYALIGNGYTVGAAGPNGIFGDETTSALEAFQDSSALPVQPSCDSACWAALFPGKHRS